MLSKSLKSSLGLYCIYYILINLVHFSLISVFSFFHFLLNHELGIIEDWLVKNSWEILFLGKMVSFSILFFYIRLNSTEEKSLRGIFKEKWNFKSLSFSAFILLSFYALIEQFGGGVNRNNVKENLLLVSYLGSGLFFFLDFLLLYYHSGKEKIQDMKILTVTTLGLVIIFKLGTILILPESNAYLVIYFLHLISLSLFWLRKHFHFIVVYCFIIIAPMSAFWGVDLVWDNAYSLYLYKNNLPEIGVIGLWAIGLRYLLR